MTLTPEAAAYVRARGGALTLRPSPRHGCCGGTVAVPVVDLGAPPDPDAWARADHAAVRVFVAPALGAAPFRVGLDTLLGLKSLFVESL